MNIYPYTHHLQEFASPEQLQSMSVELCRSMISKILGAAPTKESWSALLELVAAWPDAGEVGAWVQMLEPERNHWPWRMREIYLGQALTQGEKGVVYLLVGYLQIARIEDLFGEKLAQWGADPNWRNLRGLCLSRMETDAAAINRFLKSSTLCQLEELRVNAVEGLNGEVQKLFDRVELARLETLGLTSLDLGALDILDLALQPISQTIRTLDISANHITGRDLFTILSNGQFPNLNTLDISYGQVLADDLERSLAELKHPKLSEITIAHTPAAKALGKGTIHMSKQSGR
jgi:hypothetical protein